MKFTVYGKPAPQGSKKAFMPKGARHPVVVESAGDKLKAWRAAITQAAGQAVGDVLPLDQAVSVTITFYLLRPKAHFGTGKNSSVLKSSAPAEHSQKPDIDKLVRSTLDGLSKCCYRDDSQVCKLDAFKRWTTQAERAEIEVVSVVGEEPRFEAKPF